MTRKAARKYGTSAVAAGAAGLLALTACASASAETVAAAKADDSAWTDRSAQQISDDAKKELLSATSLRIRTEDAAAGTKVDLALDRDGNCTGSIDQGERGRLDLVKRGNQVWLRPDATYWKNELPGKEGELTAELVNGRYIHGTTDDAMLRHLSRTCDLDAFQQQVAGDGSRSADEGMTKGTPTTHEGTRVIPLSKTRGEKTQTVYVAIDGKHYPMKITTSGDGEDGTVLLSEYGTPIPTTTPSPAESVDFPHYQGQLESV